MLLQNGADASLASRFGDTAIDEAVDADTIAALKAGASGASSSSSSSRHYFWTIRTSDLAANKVLRYSACEQRLRVATIKQLKRELMIMIAAAELHRQLHKLVRL
jgi:hypothetical protein